MKHSLSYFSMNMLNLLLSIQNVRETAQPQALKKLHWKLPVQNCLKQEEMVLLYFHFFKCLA